MTRLQIAGFYAEKVVELQATEEVWSIAVTTSAIFIQKTTGEKLVLFAPKDRLAHLKNAEEFIK